MPEKAAPFARVADVPIALPLGFHQHRVIVAVDEQIPYGEAVAGGFPLGPESVTRAAEERHVARSPRDIPGLLVHEAHHEHFAAPGILHDRGYQTAKLVEIHRRTNKKPRRSSGGAA
jgi:hypothetical protein